MKPIVFVDRPLPIEVKIYLEEHFQLDYWDKQEKIDQETLLLYLERATGILTSGRSIDERLLQAAPQLKAVSTISVGYDHFDVPAMDNYGVIGMNTPYVLDDTVADLAMTLMLGCARKVAQLDRYVKEGKWSFADNRKNFGIDVHHANLGIIGMGRIGEAVARRAIFGFSMNVTYYNRTRKPDVEEQLGVTYSSLDQLLATSDFVLLLTPLTKETYHLIGREQLQQMKKTAYLINVSRGQTVDESALIEALTKEWIAGAGLDVYNQEPVPADHPLLQFEHVLTLPHIGSATEATRFKMAMLGAQNLYQTLIAQTPQNRVN
ncbi:2-hydroxyacid dehydrogenase [Paenibacillus yanchengensis]|uniref:2-hydroxyacid dehydrogenase n=1 Tax=Paenibacillus yanchengensis TaxID=2035833 RepID=A0ABW4YQ66_9BACL